MGGLTRREAITRVLLGLGGATAFSKLSWAKNTTPVYKRGFTIGEILAVSFPAVLAELRRGHPFISPDLNWAEKSDRIALRPLGPFVQVLGDPTTYPVEELWCALEWTDEDDFKNPKEWQKINFVARLLENGFYSMDDLFRERLGTGRAVVSKEYCYHRGDVLQLPNVPRYRISVFTAAAFIPGVA